MAELADLQFDSILLCISATLNSFYWQTAFLQAIYLSIASRKEEEEGSIGEKVNELVLILLLGSTPYYPKLGYSVHL